MKSKDLLALLALSFAVATGCRNDSAPEDASARDPEVVVARWKGGVIRRSAIQEVLERRLAAVPKPISPEARKAVVRQVVERRVRAAMLFAEATEKGFGERPEVQARGAAAEDKALAEDLLTRETATVKATDRQVAAEVERRLANSHPEEARKFSYIFLRAAESDTQARAAAVARMAAIRQELQKGADFNRLAEKWSTSVSARGGGRIEWTVRRSLNPVAAAAIFALKEGEVSAVVAARDGLHLFRLDGIRPGLAVDVEAVRRSVRQALDQEAKSAASRARRQQELDAHGVEFAGPAELSRLAQSSAGGAAVVAHWPGGEVRGSDLLALGGSVAAGASPETLATWLRNLVENRLLAASRRAEGLSPALSARLEEARREALINSYRQTLTEGVAAEPTEEEIARYYRERAASTLVLRDFEIDALYFPQAGESVADVYAAGEEVGAKLRDGVPFDDLLSHPARADAKLCRAAHGVDLTALGQTSIRLKKAILNLAPGGITPTLYLDGPRTVLVPGKCALEGRGVVFVRLRSIGTLPLAAAREAIRSALAREKEAAGVEAIQKRLIAASGLQIVVPEG